MPSHRPPPPTRPSRLWLGLMAAAVTGIVGGTVAAAHAVAPRVAADVRLSLTPENSPEPVGHGGLGGPLSVPSIGAVVSDPVAYLPPVPRPRQRRSAVSEPRLRVTGTPETPSQAVLSQSVAITGTPEPTVTTPTQAATTPATTAATTEAATTTTEATTTSATTTSETATTSATVSATESTEEGQ